MSLDSIHTHTQWDPTRFILSTRCKRRSMVKNFAHIVQNVIFIYLLKFNGISRVWQRELVQKKTREITIQSNWNCQIDGHFVFFYSWSQPLCESVWIIFYAGVRRWKIERQRINKVAVVRIEESWKWAPNDGFSEGERRKIGRCFFMLSMAL